MLITRRNMLAVAGSAALAPMSASAQGQNRRATIQITRRGTAPSKGAAEYFTGAVRIDSRFQGSEPGRVAGGIVTFEAGARTAWHTHPLGQTVFVSAGKGWAQVWDGPVEEINVGDIVWFAPDEKHWHGATSTTGMTHFAIAEALDGKTVDWLEQVTDAQYQPR